jgi:hypothetical protein
MVISLIVGIVAPLIHSGWSDDGGGGDGALPMEEEETRMTPYQGTCVECGQDISFESASEEWDSKAGEFLQGLTEAARLQAMRDMFDQMPCPLCQGKVRLNEAE